SQIDHDSFRRKRFAGGGSWTRVFAATALHAGIKAEYLLTVEIRKLVDSRATRLLDLFHLQRHERAHRPFGTDGKVERATDYGEKPIHRNRSEERRHQNRVQPPSRQVHRLGAAHVDTSQQGGID